MVLISKSSSDREISVIWNNKNKLLVTEAVCGRRERLAVVWCGVVWCVRAMKVRVQ